MERIKESVQKSESNRQFPLLNTIFSFWAEGVENGLINTNLDYVYTNYNRRCGPIYLFG